MNKAPMFGQGGCSTCPHLRSSFPWASAVRTTAFAVRAECMQLCPRTALVEGGARRQHRAGVEPPAQPRLHAAVSSGPCPGAGAASTRVSNMLGEGRPDAARLAALIATLLTLVASGGIVTAVLLSRQQLGHVFSTDAAVIALGASVLPILGAALLGDGANGVLAGAVAGRHFTLHVSCSDERRSSCCIRSEVHGVHRCHTGTCQESAPGGWCHMT